MASITHPNSFKIDYSYKNGQLEEISNEGNSLYKVGANDQYGRLQEAHYGNGRVETYGFNAGGLLEEISSSDLTLTYTYDSLGNIKTKDINDGLETLYDSYDYDDMNRLETVTFNANGAIGVYNTEEVYSYDSLGNIDTKTVINSEGVSDTLDYNYQDPTSAISLTSITTNQNTKDYTYDQNGNTLQSDNTTLTYSPFNKPVKIQKGCDTTEFSYDASHARYKKHAVTSSSNTITTYIGKSYEMITDVNGCTTTHKNYIYFGGKLIAVKDSTSIKYFQHDTQGNVIAISNASGDIINRRSYTPFGEIRSVATREGLQNALNQTNFTNRGYTTHEHLENLELIHMNGRVYDPTIGRFLSADPFMQSPYNTQSYNRYSYVMNNPVNLIDPSGYWSIDLGIIKIGSHGTSNGFITRAILRNKTLRIVTGVVIGALYGPAGAAAYSAFLTKSAGGSWGDALKNGAIAGASAWIAHEVADITGDYYNVDGHSVSLLSKTAIERTAGLAKSIAHGLSQTAIAKLRDGTGKGAFFSAFVTSGFSVGDKGYGGVAGRTAIMMVVGGTASSIGGGKFSNGAVTASFVHLFNDENVLSLFHKWARGKGGTHHFGPDHAMTKDLQNSPKLQKAINGWIMEDHAVNDKAILDVESFIPIGNGMLNLTRQFVGTFTASIYQIGQNRIQVVLYNNTSLNSAMYHIGISENFGKNYNLKQYYWFEESY